MISTGLCVFLHHISASSRLLKRKQSTNMKHVHVQYSWSEKSENKKAACGLTVLGSWHRSLTFLLSPMTDFPIMLRRERRSDRCQGCRQCCRLYWAWLMHTSRKRHVWLHHGFPTLSTLPWFFSRWKTKRLSLFLAIKDLCSCIARCK